jgi:xanthine dehydrogenase YagT iron-sulfur-binding subunit
VGLLREGGGTSGAHIREGMSGNLCRCGAYPQIVQAVCAVVLQRGAALPAMPAIPELPDTPTARNA